MIQSFLTARKALRIAREGAQQNFGLYNSKHLIVCYYFDYFTEIVLDIPPNLVRIPTERQSFIDFFVSARLPLPWKIDFDPSVQSEREFSHDIAERLYIVSVEKKNKKNILFQAGHHTKPEFVRGKPLRFFLEASKYSPDCYPVYELAETLRNAGCDVYLSVESNNVEYLGEKSTYSDSNIRLQERINFNPHVVVTVDSLAEGLHPDVFNVSWWLDPTPALLAGTTFSWRARDLFYSFDPANSGQSSALANFLYQCGVQKVHYVGHPYCHLTFNDLGLERHKKAVFVGVARRGNYNLNISTKYLNEWIKLIAVAEEMFLAGETMTSEKKRQLAEHSPFTEAEIEIGLWRAIVRDHSVRWLCELSEEVGIDVEIYGRFWEQYRWAKPFYKGELEHGPALASVHNETLYGLVAQPLAVLCQRTLEMAACGVIPIVYDVRNLVDKPYLDNFFLWYRTKEDMRTCLTSSSRYPPHRVSLGHTYMGFANRILEDVEQLLRLPNA